MLHVHAYILKLEIKIFMDNI